MSSTKSITFRKKNGPFYLVKINVLTSKHLNRWCTFFFNFSRFIISVLSNVLIHTENSWQVLFKLSGSQSPIQLILLIHNSRKRLNFGFKNLWTWGFFDTVKAPLQFWAMPVPVAWGLRRVAVAATTVSWILVVVAGCKQNSCATEQTISQLI